MAADLVDIHVNNRIGITILNKTGYGGISTERKNQQPMFQFPIIMKLRIQR